MYTRQSIVWGLAQVSQRGGFNANNGLVRFEMLRSDVSRYVDQFSSERGKRIGEIGEDEGFPGFA
jgi:hypothetical protein